MSYEIEKGKRVLVLNLEKTDYAGDYFKNSYGEWAVYLWAHDSNNVSPRRFEWRVVAVDQLTKWAGEIQLPTRIWEMGHAADGGTIQPYQRVCSGLNYVKAWKTAAKNRYPIFGEDGGMKWLPTIQLYTGGGSRAEEINTRGAAVFAEKRGYDADQLYAATKRLFPDPLRREYQSTVASDANRLADALYLYHNREELPFSISIESEPETYFLKNPPARGAVIG